MVTGYFGLPGCGKTTILTKIAQRELRRISRGRSKYQYVCTNYYCEGCHRISFLDLGVFDFNNCLILLDEITLDADNRNFKTFTQEKKEFFLLHRHYNCDIVYFTQQWDGVDKKIRAITSDLFFVRKAFANYGNIKLLKLLSEVSIAKRIFRTLEINEYTKDIVYGYRFPSFWEYMLGKHMVQLTFRPSWYKYFDSFDKPLLLAPASYIPWDSDVDNYNSQIENCDDICGDVYDDEEEYFYD